MRRRGHRSDDNQKAIVSALRKAGFEVYVIERPVDLLVFKRIWIPVEVKNPDGLNRTTPAQDDFFETTRGPVAVVYSPEGAIETLARMTNRGKM